MIHGSSGKVLYGQRAAEAAPVAPADRSGRHRRVVAPTPQASGKFAAGAERAEARMRLRLALAIKLSRPPAPV